ncbi:MAG: hypothetical protein HY304_02185 [candidate division Zixibacteria bacterium]|nr:hypothetical protein [candidate division Zixibacteria bacterium]
MRSVWTLSLAVFVAQVANAQTLPTLTLTCPPDARIPCDHGTDTSLTGSATVAGGCGGSVVSFSDSILTSSERGDTMLVRLWRVSDSCGQNQICRQRISLLPSPPEVAVLPLENLAGADEASRILARLLETVLGQSPHVRLVPAGAVEDAVLRQRVRQPYLMDDTQRQRLAGVLNAAYFLVGSVLAYKTVDDPYSGHIPTVACALQLTEARSGATVWSGTFHATGSDGEWLFGLGVEHDITRLAKRLADKAMRQATASLKPTVCRTATVQIPR